MAPDYSIVIPAYNEAELLPAALASVAKAMAGAGGLAGEVVVVDNASTDCTAQLAKDAGARVVFEPHRQIARARNAGAAAAHGRYLIFLDADTCVTPALLKRTLQALESGRFCGGGTGVAFDERLAPGARAMIRLWSLLSKLCRWAAGSYVFCRRDAFLAVGGFDERFYASEEVHFSRALHRWGRRRGLPVIILDEPAVTSCRKVKWFSFGQMARYALRLALNPSLLRSRQGCRPWYVRPEGPRA